jgi:quercetin dioxygenase-like cupin family protein
MSGNFTKAEWSVRFNPSKAVKEDLFRGTHLFVGLNCFEPGQSQTTHEHGGTDKFYYVMSGRAVIRVGDVSQEVETGSLVWAPADIPHGVEQVTEQTVMMVGMAPPPRR